MSRINQKFSINPEKTKGLGKLFHTIDMNLNENLSSENIRKMYKDVPVGTFEIGNSSFNVTISELERIIETGNKAIEIFHKKYQLGLYGK